MKARILILLGAALFLTAAYGQTDSTIYVKTFPGRDVGAKIAAAQAACGSNTAVPCILVVDPSLAAWPAGTMPTLCSHCYLSDYRNGTPSAGVPRKGEFDPYAFGAAGDGATNDGTAIQNALNTAGALGGGIVRLHPGTYKITSSLSVPNGVLLRGSGNFIGYSGTIIENAGSTAAFVEQPHSGGGSQAGSGRSIEISDLYVNTTGTATDCMDFLVNVDTVPQFFTVKNVVCGGGGTRMYMTGVSYGVFEHIGFSPTAPTSTPCLDLEGVAGGYVEASRFLDINTQGCGVKIGGQIGNDLYFDRLDINDAPGDGLLVGGSDSFDLFFKNTNVVRSGTNSIELDGSAAYLGRIHFQDTTILTTGTSASEHAIYAHSGGFGIFDTDFYFTDINRGGSTVPTALISTDAAACVSFEQLRNGNADPLSITASCPTGLYELALTGPNGISSNPGPLTFGNGWKWTINGVPWGVLTDTNGVNREIIEPASNSRYDAAGSGEVQLNFDATGGTTFGDGGGNQVAAILGSGAAQFHGGSANHALCWKSDAKTLGYCSAVVAADGTCGTCN